MANRNNPTTREDIINYMDDLVSRSILDNHVEFTKKQLADYAFNVIFKALDERGLFDTYPDVDSE